MQISVLLPSHNAEGTILTSVRSTLNALGSSDELLVGLHNCSDGTSRELEKVSDPRLKVIRVTGGGLSVVLNELLKASSKELVARMDSDDICLPWRFVLQRSQLRGADVIFSTALIGFGGSKVRFLIPQYPLRLSSKDVNLLLTSLNPLVHPTMLAKKAAILSVGGYRDVPGEDLDLWLRMAVKGLKIERLAIPTIIYRVGHDQLSNQAWYKEGWKVDSGIQDLRQELMGSLPGNVSLNPRLRLEIIGFPKPENFKRVGLFLRNFGSKKFL